jgi:hypothetical protein
MVGAEVPADEIGTRVAIRMGRREEFLRRQSARLLALIGEAALRQMIGSREIMSEQLGFLLEMAELPDIEVRVVGFDSGWQPALEGTVLLMESDAQPTVAHLEFHVSGLFLHTRSDVAAFRQAADNVTERAMSVEDSAAVIALAKAAWEAA